MRKFDVKKISDERVLHNGCTADTISHDACVSVDMNLYTLNRFGGMELFYVHLFLISVALQAYLSRASERKHSEYAKKKMPTIIRRRKEKPQLSFI